MIDLLPFLEGKFLELSFSDRSHLVGDMLWHKLRMENCLGGVIQQTVD